MSKSTMQSFLESSYLSNSDYLDNLYEQFLKDPNALSQEWRDYFQKLPQVNGYASPDVSHEAVQHAFVKLSRQLRKPVASVPSGDAAYERKQAAVDRLIDAYRTHGHLAANFNPLPHQNPQPPQLNLSYYPELSPGDVDVKFRAESLLPAPTATLKEILAKLNAVYCGSIGSEYMYIENFDEVAWIQKRLEYNRPILSPETKREILAQLIAADGLEKYLATKYVGQKRFSLEGGDGFIPFVHALNEQSAAQGIKEIAIGMAHRGRLNILINVFGKPSAELYQEFEGQHFGLTSGDVKYHIGEASDIETKSGSLHLSLAFNPSHLEIIDAVLMGSVGARQDRREPQDRFEVMGFIVHGDASLAGQGVVMETLNMSQTNAYQIGGAVHAVINNQVGFTISNPKDARSSRYCTDIAKMIEAPVFHVNGDDPEAIVFLAQLAVDYRRKFKKDVFVDLVCYRRLGHNEADEPAATQPLMYHFIRKHLTPREIYARKLIEEGVCTQAQADQWMEDYRNKLDAGLPTVEAHNTGLGVIYESNWKPFIDQPWYTPAKTAVPKEKLIAIAGKIEVIPEGFEVQRQVGNMLANRIKMTEGELPLDWGYAETMAYATLLDQGYPVRMSGEDCQRGTFAHRHAVLHDQNTDETYIPLQHIGPHQASFEIYDSLLSEEGALGYEYGYASTDPNTLVLWEAQYGDFVNGAQVVIDQFISSAWQKWRTLCGLTMLLPHGYEGDGPEHTSARLERFLQMSAEKNMQVCVPTSPSQIFHLLRRQMIRQYRTPLIVMTPKSILRHKQNVSSLDDLSHGQFQLVIPDANQTTPLNQIQRLVICSGKVYYDLIGKLQEKNLGHIAIIRIEQLYPFPHDDLTVQTKKYAHVKDVIWCQEEPKNQGAWLVMRHRMEACLAKGQTLHYAGRPPSASPAVGYRKLHVKQQEELINQALGI